MSYATQKPLAASVQKLQDVAVNHKQKGMIDDLKNMGLLNKPNFSLAYGPTASMVNVR